MTSLLVGTFVVGGAHTLLWLPRAMQMRRELREAEEAEERALEAEEKAAAEQLGAPGPRDAAGEPPTGNKD